VSSRRRHTRSKRDWSSDVCSSDLRAAPMPTATTVLMEEFFMSMHSSQNLKVGCGRGRLLQGCRARPCILPSDTRRENQNDALFRSEERRVGKKGRDQWCPEE